MYVVLNCCHFYFFILLKGIMLIKLLVLAITAVYAVDNIPAGGVEMAAGATLTEYHFSKMTVKTLRTFISERGSTCALCTEKHEFVQMALELKDVEPLPAPAKEEKRGIKESKKGKPSFVEEEAAEKMRQFQKGDFGPNGDSPDMSSWTNPLDAKKKAKSADGKKATDNKKTATDGKKPDRKAKKEKAKEETVKATKKEDKNKNPSKKKSDASSSGNGGSNQFDDEKMNDLQDMLRKQGMNAKMFNGKDFEGMSAEEMASKFGGGFDGGSSSGSGSSFKKRAPKKKTSQERPVKETDLTENNRRATDHVDPDIIEL